MTTTMMKFRVLCWQLSRALRSAGWLSQRTRRGREQCHYMGYRLALQAKQPRCWFSSRHWGMPVSPVKLLTTILPVILDVDANTLFMPEARLCAGA